MTDELPDDVTTGLGQRLLRRATIPGVIRPGLGASLQRRFSTGGGGLAAEIWQRWSPAALPAWGYGSGWPHASFGGWAGWGSPRPAALTPDPSPGRPPGPPGEGSEGRASFTPSISPPSRQPEAGMKESDWDVTAPPSPGGPGGRLGEGPGVRASARRGPLPSHPPRGEEPRPAPASSRGPSVVQRKAAATVRPLPSGAQAGPVIERRATDPDLAQRASALRSGAHMGRAIFRRSSSGPAPSAMPMQRTSLPATVAGPLPSASLLRFAQPARREPEPAAAVSPVAAATRNAQPRPSSTVDPVQPTMTSNLLPAAPLPLARPARVIERAAIATGSAAEPQPGTGMDSVPSFPAALPGSMHGAARPAAAEKLDLDDLADRVLRRLTRSLAVERERHGGRRWL